MLLVRADETLPPSFEGQALGEALWPRFCEPTPKALVIKVLSRYQTVQSPNLIHHCNLSARSHSFGLSRLVSHVDKCQNHPVFCAEFTRMCVHTRPDMLNSKSQGLVKKATNFKGDCNTKATCSANARRQLARLTPTALDLNNRASSESAKFSKN